MTIGLPFAKKASQATPSRETDVVVFNNNNGSSTVPVPHEDGSLQISTVITNAKAPKRYDYPITVPRGASLTRSAKGVVAVVKADGSPVMVFGDAWAKDAHGKAVPTHYEVKGNTLTQVIEFTTQTAFPVVADPQTTGVYSYNCVLQNGSSYFMKPGEPLPNCKGSRLQKYINGRMVQTIPLTGYGQPANPRAFGTPECFLSLGGGLALSVFGIPGKLARFLSGAIAFVAGASLPSITSCRG